MNQFPELAPTALSIMLGGGARLSITQNDDLIVEDDFVRFSLGRCTMERLNNLQSFLERLKIHAVPVMQTGHLDGSVPNHTDHSKRGFYPK